MKKHVIKISILAIWLALMGWWWLESRSWPVPEKIEAAFLPDFTDNFGLYFGEQKVGWVSKSLRRQPGGEYQAMQGTNVELLINGRRLEIHSSALVNLGPSLALMDFRYLIQAGGVAVAESGQAAGNFLSVSVNLGEYAPLMEALAQEFGPMLGERAKYLDFGKEAVMSAPEGPALAAAFPPFLSHLGLAAGRNYTLDTLDPFTRTLVSTSLRVEEESREYDPETGREEPVFKVRGGAAGQETFLWIDRYGRTLREEGLGFSITRAYDLAEARRDIVPLTPPPAFQRLLKGRNVDQLLETVESLRVEREQP